MVEQGKRWSGGGAGEKVESDDSANLQSEGRQCKPFLFFENVVALKRARVALKRAVWVVALKRAVWLEISRGSPLDVFSETHFSNKEKHL